MTAEVKTPVAELLDEVPEDIVLGIQGNEPVFKSYHNIPIGQLAKEAAAEIRRLQALCQEMLGELYVYRASEHLKDVTASLKARMEKAK
jgi:hypothetical protein